MKRKAQSSIELIALISALIFFLTIFLGIIYDNISEKSKEKETIVVKNLALSILDEITLAAKSSNGYYRNFEVPETINSKSYEINITSERVYIKTSANAMSYPVQNITGKLKKGVNIIKKENGIVYLN